MDIPPTVEDVDNVEPQEIADIAANEMDTALQWIGFNIAATRD
jgi:hypothetical protein